MEYLNKTDERDKIIHELNTFLNKNKDSQIENFVSNIEIKFSTLLQTFISLTCNLPIGHTQKCFHCPLPGDTYWMLGISQYRQSTGHSK